MIARTAFVALVLAVLGGEAAWGLGGGRTFESLEKHEKYGNYARAKIIARRLRAKSEQALVAKTLKARADYLKALEELKKLYADLGDAEALSKVTAEIKDFADGRRFAYLEWEDLLPELSAKNVNAKANALLAKATKLRGSLNPFGVDERARKAAELFRAILEKHPTSTATERAAYGLGQVYASSKVGEYARAVRFYELCYYAKSTSTLYPLYQAARVMDHDLADHEGASRYYYIVSMTVGDHRVRAASARRLKKLQTMGFGLKYREKKPEVEKDPEVKEKANEKVMEKK